MDKVDKLAQFDELMRKCDVITLRHTPVIDDWTYNPGEEDILTINYEQGGIYNVTYVTKAMIQKGRREGTTFIVKIENQEETISFWRLVPVS